MLTKNKKNNPLRLHLLDAFRGITIISMIVFHTCWDLMYYGMGISYQVLYGPVGYVWQQSICWSFIFLSGFCFSLGKKPLKQGITVFVAGVIVSVVTFLVDYDARILFGVLTLLGTSTLIMCLIDRFMPKEKGGAVIALIICIILFVVTKSVSSGYLGFESIKICNLPRELYANYVTAFLGFPQPGFYSSDYFGIMPWLFLYMSGYFTHKLIGGSEGVFCSFCRRHGCRPLEFLGRHSLVIYMAHQVAIYGIVTLIHMLFWRN